jgi:hypothetical protein
MARQVSLLLSAWSAWRRCWRNPDGMGVVYVESARARLPSGPGPIRVSWRGETEPSGQTARARQPHLAADLSFEARGSSCLASHDPRTHPVGCPQNRGAFMAASHLWSLLAPKGLASGQSKPVVESARASRCRRTVHEHALVLNGIGCFPFEDQCGVESRYALAMAGRDWRRITPRSPKPTRASG